MSRIIAGTALAGLLGLALVNLSSEWTIKRLSDVDAGLSPARPQDALLAYRQAMEDAPARALLLSASIIARGTAASSPSDQLRDVLRSEALALQASRQRPLWPQASLIRAYIAGVKSGGVNPESNRLVEQSYRQAPFLESESDWRIRYVVEAWPTAGPALRRHAIEEAIWRSTDSAAMWVHIRLLLEGTPAYRPYLQARSTIVGQNALFR